MIFDSNSITKNIKIWKSKYFTSSQVNQQGYLWLRIPVKLNKYQIKCRMRAKYNKISNNWYPFTKTIFINIPSSLIDFPYKIDDIVRYKPENNYYCLGWGKVIQIMDDYHLKLRDLNNNSKKAKEYIIHSNKVVHQSVAPSFLIDISLSDSDILEIDRKLVLRYDDNNNNNAMDIYQTLSEIYGRYAQLYGDNIFCNPLVDNKEHFNDIGKYFSRNIIAYLFSSLFNWRICCRLDDKHGIMNFSEMRAYHIEHSVDSIKQGFGKELDIDGSWNICDLCHINMNKFHLIFYCKTNLSESHDYCLKCINIMVNEHYRLQQLLQDILQNDNIPKDCVEIIVHFIVGRIVKF